MVRMNVTPGLCTEIGKEKKSQGVFPCSDQTACQRPQQLMNSRNSYLPRLVLPGQLSTTRFGHVFCKKCCIQWPEDDLQRKKQRNVCIWMHFCAFSKSCRQLGLILRWEAEKSSLDDQQHSSLQVIKEGKWKSCRGFCFYI